VVAASIIRAMSKLVYAALQPRRQPLPYSQPSEPQISQNTAHWFESLVSKLTAACQYRSLASTKGWYNCISRIGQKPVWHWTSFFPTENKPMSTNGNIRKLKSMLIKPSKLWKVQALFNDSNKQNPHSRRRQQYITTGKGLTPSRSEFFIPVI
jgi:hypothetical protein